MRKSVTVKLPEFEIINKSYDDIFDFIKHQKQVIRSQIEKKFNCTQSSAEKKLMALIRQGRIKKEKMLIKLSDDQARHMNVYKVAP